jgi:hypothetical protein
VDHSPARALPLTGEDTLCDARIQTPPDNRSFLGHAITKMLGFRARKLVPVPPPGHSPWIAVSVPAPCPRPGDPRGFADQANL